MVKNWSKGTRPLVSGQLNASEHASSKQGLLSLLLQKGSDDEATRSFLLRVIQPGLSGLMDGSVSGMPDGAPYDSSESKPSERARATACTRLFTPSFSKMWVT
jgi:hypothetical protein